jgi:hypothetical protein
MTMRIGYVSLEEAHPPFERVQDTRMGAAFLSALAKAAAQGKLRIPVPDSARNELLARKKRHAFHGQREG